MTARVVPSWEAVACHEAGHAVVAVVLGCRFEYVTMRPRGGGHAAHVQFPRRAVLRDGQWEAAAAVGFGGIVAEEFHYCDEACLDPGSAGHDRLRRALTRHSGRADLRDVRDLTRHALEWHSVDPGWSATPIGDGWSPTDLAATAWRRAVGVVLAYVDAVGVVAEELLTAPRALRWARAREVVAGVGPGGVPDDVPDWVWRPWFLDHTRLRWDRSRPAAASCVEVVA
ncbi:MAG: hypothetical protein ACRD0V_21485 [Acidimicrobiales bacterium]